MMNVMRYVKRAPSRPGLPCADPESFVRGGPKASVYDQEIPQPHTAEQPTAL